MTVAKPGDAVLLSFGFCKTCSQCETGHPAYCESYSRINIGGKPGVYTDDRGSPIAGGFFDQSTFGNLAVVGEESVVNVDSIIKSREELQLFAPLGCGYQTGSAAVTQIAGAKESDTVVVLGLGGVGQTAVMVSFCLQSLR